MEVVRLLHSAVEWCAQFAVAEVDVSITAQKQFYYHRAPHVTCPVQCLPIHAVLLGPHAYTIRNTSGNPRVELHPPTHTQACENAHTLAHAGTQTRRHTQTHVHKNVHTYV